MKDNLWRLAPRSGEKAEDYFSKRLADEIAQSTLAKARAEAKAELNNELTKLRERALSAERKAEQIEDKLNSMKAGHKDDIGKMQAKLDDMREVVKSLRSEIKSSNDALHKAKDDARTLSAMEKSQTHDANTKVAELQGRVSELTRQLEQSKEQPRKETLPPKVTIPSFRAVPVRNQDGTIREVTLIPGD